MNPETAFLNTLHNKVFPAMERGINLQVTTGMVERREPDSQSGSKPKTLPGWMTLLDGLFGEAPMRFLSLVQFLPNLRDPYWQAPIRSEKPGACFAVPLGEGYTFTAGDMQVAEEVQSTVCGRSLHIVSIQRTRLTRRKGGQPMQDGVPLEAYNLAGELVWKNPFKSLDDAIQEAESLQRNPGVTTAVQHQAIPPVTPSTPAPLVEAPQPAAPQGGKGDKPAQILALHAKYSASMTGDDLITLIARLAGVPTPGVKAVLKANQEDPRAAQVRQAAAQLQDLNLEMELLVEAVTDMTGLPQDLITQVLSNKPAEAVPAPIAAPPQAPAPAPAPAPSASRPKVVKPEKNPEPKEEDAGEVAPHSPVATALGLRLPSSKIAGTPAAPAGKKGHDPSPLGPVVVFSDFQEKQPQIQQRVLDHIRKSSKKGASPSELRTLLGIPEGSKGEGGRLAAALKRNILTPLCDAGALVQEGSTRGVFYLLAETDGQAKG